MLESARSGIFHLGSLASIALPGFRDVVFSMVMGDIVQMALAVITEWMERGVGVQAR